MREHILHSYPWILNMLAASFTNVVFAWPQIWKVWQTKRAGDISLIGLGMLFYVQASFTTQGFLNGDHFIAWSGLLSAASNLVLIGSTLYIRRQSRTPPPTDP